MTKQELEKQIAELQQQLAAAKQQQQTTTEDELLSLEQDFLWEDEDVQELAKEDKIEYFELNEMSQKFNILQGCIVKNEAKEEINIVNIYEDMINNYEGENLLIAGAGTGKTYSVFEYAKRNTDKTIILAQPTIALVASSEASYSNAMQEAGVDTTFIYSDENGQSAKATGNENVIVCTFDKYKEAITSVYEKDINNEKEIILFKDEFHELVSFCQINDRKKDNLSPLFLNNYRGYDIKSIAITATPFNIANSFAKKVFIKKDTCNKEIIIHETNSIVGNAIDIIKKADNNRKFLVYINNKSYTEEFTKMINRATDKTAEFLYSEIKYKKDVYNDIINNNEIQSDVVVATKMLNIGVDIQNLFTDVIYMDETLRPNDTLQLLNRERQQATFHVMINSKKNDFVNTELNMNDTDITNDVDYTKFYETIYLDKINADKISGYINDHLNVDVKKYKNIHLGKADLVVLLKQFYNNIDIAIETESFEEIYFDVKKYDEEINRIKKELGIASDADLYDVVREHKMVEQNKIILSLSKTFRMKLYNETDNYFNFLYVKDLLDNIEYYKFLTIDNLQIEYTEENINKMRNAIDSAIKKQEYKLVLRNSYEYLVKNLKSNKEEIETFLNKILNMNEMSKYDYLNLISEFNRFEELLVLNDGKKVNDKTFRKVLAKIGINIKSIRKTVNGKKETFYSNQTVNFKNIFGLKLSEKEIINDLETMEVLSNLRSKQPVFKKSDCDIILSKEEFEFTGVRKLVIDKLGVVADKTKPISYKYNK